MIRVTIDLITYTTGSAGQELYTVEITNDGTGNRDVGNYDVVVKSPMSSATDGSLRRTRVEGWPRSEKDAMALVIRALGSLGWGE